MIEEGQGESNRVNYAYTLTRSKVGCGSYTCRVHRTFLESPSKELWTKEFNIGGHLWQLKLINTSDGNLSAYLYSRSKSSVGVHACFTVVNHADSKSSNSLGYFHRFSLGSYWGYAKLAHIAKIKDQQIGFLKRDVFTVKLDLRLKLAQNESFVVSADSRSATCIWKIKDLYGASPPIIDSEGFKIGDLKWRLGIWPHGERTRQRDMTIHVYNDNNERIDTEITLTLIDNLQPEKNITRDTMTRMQKLGSWHYLNFINSKLPNDEMARFLKNDWITLTARIAIKDQPKELDKASAMDLIQAVHSKEENLKCLLCNGKAAIAGVLHGNTTHKCYCMGCARSLKNQNKCTGFAKLLKKRCNLNCPICGEKVERIVEHML